MKTTAQGARRRSPRKLSRRMLIQSIRELNHAVPFQPYAIRTSSGRKVTVPHPEFILISPRGGWVIVTDEFDCPRQLSALLIEEVTPLGRTRKPSRRREA